MLATIKLSHTIYNSDNVTLLELYTAISIYVVGSKLQGYGTRPKGGMGRLELILGFRGCRREMDMDIGDLRCMDEALLILLIIIH